jgi:hypothetical protein
MPTWAFWIVYAVLFGTFFAIFRHFRVFRSRSVSTVFMTSVLGMIAVQEWRDGRIWWALGLLALALIGLLKWRLWDARRT